MKRSYTDFFSGVKDIPYQYTGELSHPELSYKDKCLLARKQLKTFQLANLDFLRSFDFSRKSTFDNLTIITYTFPQEESDYLQVEFAILHTWRLLGRLPTVIVANKHFPLLDTFANKWPDSISIQLQPSLVCGDNRSISIDCLENLYKRFSTDFCLTVQDDGFPLKDNLTDFLGRYDFIGAPVIRARIKPLEILIQAANKTWFNGGFSLRSRRLCERGATAYAQWHSSGQPFQQEDVFFSHTLRQYKDLAKGLKFPSLQTAREFAATDIGGCVDVHARGYIPFGFHSPTTALQFIPELAAFGYSIPKE